MGIELRLLWRIVKLEKWSRSSVCLCDEVAPCTVQLDSLRIILRLCRAIKSCDKIASVASVLDQVLDTIWILLDLNALENQHQAWSVEIAREAFPDNLPLVAVYIKFYSCTLLCRKILIPQRY